MAIRVLIADPHRSLANAYRGQLVASGCEAMLTDSGVECLKILKQFRPDVLVLGEFLPWGGCDGVLTAMKEEGQVPRPLVIVLAACRDTSLLYRLAALQVDYFESTPLSPADLCTLIRGQFEPEQGPNVLSGAVRRRPRLTTK